MDIFDVPNRTPSVLAPEGKHTGILYLLADLGCHKETYDGKETIKHKIYVAFELVGTKMEDGRPFVIGKEFTVSPSRFHKGDYYFAKTSNAYKMIKSWANKDKVRSDPGILIQLLNSAHPASLAVEHAQSRKNPDRTYAVIESVKPYKGKDEPKRVNEPVDGLTNPDAVWDKLPEWIQKKIASSLERNGGVPDEYYAGVSDANDSDIPF